MAEDHGYVDIYDGSEIAVLMEGVELFSLQSLGWDTDQKKEVKRSLGRRKRGNPVNDGTNVIGISRGDLEITLDMEFLEFNGAILEQALSAKRSGEKVLEDFTIGNQTVRCLQDLRNLSIVINYPVINGVRRKGKFFGVEITKQSGEVKIGEAPGQKCSAIATSCEGLV